MHLIVSLLGLSRTIFYKLNGLTNKHVFFEVSAGLESARKVLLAGLVSSGEMEEGSTPCSLSLWQLQVVFSNLGFVHISSCWLVHCHSVLFPCLSLGLCPYFFLFVRIIIISLRPTLKQSHLNLIISTKICAFQVRSDFQVLDVNT